jgi:hypothetical protein
MYLQVWQSACRLRSLSKISVSPLSFLHPPFTPPIPAPIDTLSFSPHHTLSRSLPPGTDSCDKLSPELLPAPCSQHPLGAANGRAAQDPGDGGEGDA